MPNRLLTIIALVVVLAVAGLAAAAPALAARSGPLALRGGPQHHEEYRGYDGGYSPRRLQSQEEYEAQLEAYGGQLQNAMGLHQY